MSKFTFFNPVKVHYGINEINNFGKIIKNRRVFLVTSEGFIKRGIVKKLQGLTSKITTIICDVQSHPTFEYLQNTYLNLNHNNFDIIVALGGGSVIDTSKIISVYSSQKDFGFVESLIRNKEHINNYKLKPIIAIPTTAGTGSELTPWATVWDNEEKKKYSLHLLDLWCEASIYDPQLTLSVPKSLTVQTGLDAFSQCLEVIWNKNTNPISTELATSAAKEIFNTLPLLANDLNNIKLRSDMMLASIKMGLAFSNTQTSIAHAISYYITANKGIPHGIACSFTIPWIIKFILNENKDIDKNLKDIFGKNILDNVNNFFRKLKVKTNFYDYGLNKQDLENIYSEIQTNSRAKNFVLLDKLNNEFKNLINKFPPFERGRSI